MSVSLNISSLNNLKAKSKSWGFTPHPTKEDCSSYPPWMLQDAPTELKAPCAHCQICYRFRRMRPCTCESYLAIHGKTHAICLFAQRQLRGEVYSVTSELTVNSKRFKPVLSFLLCGFGWSLSAYERVNSIYYSWSLCVLSLCALVGGIMAVLVYSFFPIFFIQYLCRYKNNNEHTRINNKFQWIKRIAKNIVVKIEVFE
ncbi:hypothetical protein DET47_101252 [Shewanella putrefaciens]|nr:hypothetical protein DET47_101252 [Shewanella putrefaciens]